MIDLGRRAYTTDESFKLDGRKKDFIKEVR
jgi:hypothetical protein